MRGESARRFVLVVVGVMRARTGSKPARSNPQEQYFPGRAEFFALPQPPNGD
jgi:hypothetical protein